MRRTPKSQNRRSRLPGLVSYRPLIELLEERLPPGDVILGHGLVGSWLGQNISLFGADSAPAVNRHAEVRFGSDTPAGFSAFVVLTVNSSRSGLPVTAGSSPSQAGNMSQADPTAADRERAGLDEHSLD